MLWRIGEYLIASQCGPVSQGRLNVETTLCAEVQPRSAFALSATWRPICRKICMAGGNASRTTSRMSSVWALDQGIFACGLRLIGLDAWVMRSIVSITCYIDLLPIRWLGLSLLGEVRCGSHEETSFG